jgi:hypothetical protein
MSEWRPIEIAPKVADKPILLRCGQCPPFIGWWDAATSAFVMDGGRDGWIWYDAISHCMIIPDLEPAPPAADNVVLYDRIMSRLKQPAE